MFLEIVGQVDERIGESLVALNATGSRGRTGAGLSTPVTFTSSALQAISFVVLNVLQRTVRVTVGP